MPIPGGAGLNEPTELNGLDTPKQQLGWLRAYQELNAVSASMRAGID